MPPLIGVAVVAACVGTLALMVLLIHPLREAASSAISGDTDALRSQLDSAAGIAVLYVLALMHTVIWFPAEILDAAQQLSSQAPMMIGSPGHRPQT